MNQMIPAIIGFFLLISVISYVGWVAATATNGALEKMSKSCDERFGKGNWGFENGHSCTGKDDIESMFVGMHDCFECVPINPVPNVTIHELEVIDAKLDNLSAKMDDAQRYAEQKITITVYNASTPSVNNTIAKCTWIIGSDGYLPDPICSPGDVLTTNTSLVCTSGYSSKVRNVSEKTKDRVYADYGILNRATGQFEMDHIIPLELGGSNDVKNLFPEPALPKPGFREKDRLENWLNDQVCQHGMNISQAQEMIARNWTAAYKSMT